LKFKDQKIHSLSIAANDYKYSSSFSEWSKEDELERKKLHDKILNEDLDQSNATLNWGVVSSTYDEKSGGSSIFIEYRKEEKEKTEEKD